MKVCVTGAAGFVGSHLSESLVRDGHEVVGLDSFVPYYDRSVKERNLAHLLSGSSAFRLAEVDLRDGDLDEVLDGVEGVVHCAAMPGLAKSWSDFALYQDCNLLGTQRLLEAARRASVGRFVHISTSSVYGLDATGDETTPVTPNSPYGVTKLAAEQLALAYHRTYDLPVTVLRLFSVYGPRQRPDMAYTIFVDAVTSGRPVVVHGDGLQSRSNTYVDDAVAAITSALERCPVGEVFNIGGGKLLTVLEALALIGEHAGAAPVLTWAPARPGDQRATSAVIDKARAVLGYSPSVDPTDGLKRQVEWQLDERAATAPLLVD
jgi:nucleoside-diphosphate-sugar epimerase